MTSKLKKSIALVVPGIAILGGGVATLTEFLYGVIAASGRYQVDIISVAVSAQDQNSVRLLSPATWFRPVQITEGRWRGIPYRHVGAVLTEFEFQRYRPRYILSDLLNRYDLVQFIAGGPAIAFSSHKVKRPVCLQVATSMRLERESYLKQLKGWKRLQKSAMLQITAHIEQLALKQMSYVFAISKYTEQVFKESVSANRLIFGPPGVDTDLFYPASDRANDYLLSVGRFEDPRKNVPLLFQTYHLLRQINPNAPKLILAGRNGPTSEDWKLAESLGVLQYIEFRQDLSMPQLADLYRNAVLFVLSSNEEGLGIVLLEAMASGLAVVSTRCGGTESAVVEGVTGYLTPIGDAQELATKMQVLLANPVLRQNMGDAGRRYVEQHFSIAATGKVFLDKYAELLSGPE